MADPKPALPALPMLPLYAQLSPAVRQVLLLVGLAAAIAAGLLVVLWSQGASYSPLYSGLGERDSAEIVTLLDGSGIPYRFDPAGGGVLVPADRKYEVRMQMAQAGLPRGTGFGIEQMPERATFGQTPFMENALYVHAVETELARTIGSMQSVEAARVHLALPPQSAFVRQQRQPSASVMLKLFPGRRLDRAQVQSVVHLVASSVPDLVPGKVTVVDQTGALLSSPGADEASVLTSTQFEYRRQLEDAYAERIEGLLASAVGPGRVRASVSAELDFTVNEQTRESFDPNVALVRSEQTSEESQSGNAFAQGIPGSLSNQPPADAAAGGAEGVDTALSTSRSAVRNFELDRTITHTKQAPGAIRRLSIGVLIDNKPAEDGRGPGEPLGEAELASLTELAKQAVGFVAERGDTISVLNSAFQAPEAVAPPAPPPLWERPALWDIARQGLAAALVLVLAWVVVRPVMTVLTRPQPVAPAEIVPGGALAAAGRPLLPHSYEDRVAAARAVAGQDPRQVAQVVRNWVKEDNG